MNEQAGEPGGRNRCCTKEPSGNSIAEKPLKNTVKMSSGRLSCRVEMLGNGVSGLVGRSLARIVHQVSDLPN